jgi:hypothetical protein
MALYVLTCIDKENALDLRMANRPTHLDYVAASGMAKVAGPFLDKDDKPCGSLLIIEAESREAAEAFAANDPYALAGLFQSVEIRPWRAVMGLG